MINSRESFHSTSCNATQVFAIGSNETCIQERLLATIPTLQELEAMTCSAFKSNDLALFFASPFNAERNR
jgi:hypothetical protein